MTSMRYKTYTWPHNPETYEMTWERKVSAHKIPFGQYCMQDLGVTCRVMRGEGVFAGAKAYQEFQKLADVFSQDGPGLLTHPVWQTARAYFVTLKLKEQPLPDYVYYSFEFWEDGISGTGLTLMDSESTALTAVSTVASSNSVYDTVKKGDTLWGIAKSYGVTLAALIAKNPQIKNPNLIYPGDKVRIR